MDGDPLPVDVGHTKAHPARAYDYYLGGKDNFEADRELAGRTEKVWPTVRVFARENREFMSRVVHYLAAEEGVGQYLDIGSGMPTAPNVHEIAQRRLPSSRVVYVDNDPLVISHARSLLRSGPEGRAGYLYADVRQPEAIIAGASEVLDFSRPVALLLIAVLHFVADEWDPQDDSRHSSEGATRGELPCRVPDYGRTRSGDDPRGGRYLPQGNRRTRPGPPGRCVRGTGVHQPGATHYRTWRRAGLRVARPIPAPAIRCPGFVLRRRWPQTLMRMFMGLHPLGP